MDIEYTAPMEDKRIVQHVPSRKRKMKSVVTIPDKSALRQPTKFSKTVTHIPTPLHLLDPICVLLLGHSYVTRYMNAQLEWMTHTGETLLESVNLEDSLIDLQFTGRPGLMVRDIFQLMYKHIRDLPSVVVLEIGQNDLCWRRNKPLQLAHDLYDEIHGMFHIFEYLEMVTVCQPIQKHKMTRGDKPKEKLNEDIVAFNYEFLKLTRKDTRILRWPHKKFKILTPLTSTDGTHPNTVEGYWLYQQSITSCCNYSKRELYLRRGKSHPAIEKRRKSMRKQRSERRKARKAAANVDPTDSEEEYGDEDD